MNSQKFTNRACDEMGYYVYCLVDPRDNKVFYVGKGKGDRVFAHIHNAETQGDEREKDRRINEIGVENVRHYVVRHGLTDAQAKELESTLIDFLMDERVNGGNDHLTNLIHGHHHGERGLKTIEEINAKFPEKEFHPGKEDKVIIVLLNSSFKESDDIYERARGTWAFSEEKIRECTHVLAVHHGIVRAVYPVNPEAWEMVRDKMGRKQPRWRFTAEADKESPYLYARIYSEIPVETSSGSRSNRKKVSADGKTISPRRGAWCANY